MSETATATIPVALFPYTDKDVYKAVVREQAIEMNDRFGQPQLVLRVRLTDKLDNRYEPTGSSKPLDDAFQANKTLQMSMEPGDRLTKTLRDLSSYGFDTNAGLETLSTDHPKGFKLVGKTIHVRVQVKKDKTDNPVDYWWLADNRPQSKKMTMAELTEFAKKNQQEIKSSREAVNEAAPY